MRPTHITESNLLYSQSSNLSVNCILKIAAQQHRGWCLTKDWHHGLSTWQVKLTIAKPNNFQKSKRVIDILKIRNKQIMTKLKIRNCKETYQTKPIKNEVDITKRIFKAKGRGSIKEIHYMTVTYILNRRILKSVLEYLQ